jgi:hypothetical protein
MTDTRVAICDDTTHILHFAHYCGASRLDRLRGKGLWVLMTVADYNQGAAHSGREAWDWETDAPKGAPVGDLAAWASAKTGYPVTLIRDDKLIDPDWESLIAYRVTTAGNR